MIKQLDIFEEFSQDFSPLAGFVIDAFSSNGDCSIDDYPISPIHKDMFEDEWDNYEDDE